MSEQEIQPAAATETPKSVTATHRAAMLIGDDGRQVIVHRLEDGGYHLEWSKPDPDNGAARISTSFSLSREAFEATLNCVIAIDGAIDEAAELEASVQA